MLFFDFLYIFYDALEIFVNCIHPVPEDDVYRIELLDTIYDYPVPEDKWDKNTFLKQKYFSKTKILF